MGSADVAAAVFFRSLDLSYAFFFDCSKKRGAALVLIKQNAEHRSLAFDGVFEEYLAFVVFVDDALGKRET